MAEQGEHKYWGDRFQSFAPAWTNEKELAELADAIVLRGQKIEHKIVPDLRALIEAVQQHPDARLAEIGEDGKPTISDPTQIEIHGAEIASSQCNGHYIRVALVAHSCFVIDAEFLQATFTGAVDFQRATFRREANFGYATFTSGADFWQSRFLDEANFCGARLTGQTNFMKARFEKRASFVATTFLKRADFRRCYFGLDADFTDATFTRDVSFGGFNEESTFVECPSFYMAKFAHDADFRSVTFKKGAFFRYATMAKGAAFGDSKINCKADFRDVTIDGRLELAGAELDQKARFWISKAFLRPGSEVTLPEQRIAEITVRESFNFTSRKERWFDESKLQPHEHGMRLLMWLLQYLFVFISPWSDHAWPWLCRVLGINSHGTFISGEDSDNPKGLLAAAAQYNLLRNNFRQQPASDSIEDECHFRYMELRRRAGNLWMQLEPLPEDATHEPPSPLRWFQGFFIDGFLYWFIWRNCVGYLVRPLRPFVTGFFVILICWGIYCVGASNDTILFNGSLKEGQTAMHEWNKTAFTPLYFSVTTFTTLGYGDFAPTGWLRAVAGAQALIGVGLIALFTVAWGRKMIR